MNNQAIVSQPKISFTQFISADKVQQRAIQILGTKKALSFTSSIVSAVQTNQPLKECEPNSIFNAALLGESLNLSPSPQLGQYYLVPFNNKEKGKIAQFQLGYKGYIQLAIRSGYYKKLNVLSIKKGELIKYDPLEEEIVVNFIDDEVIREETETIGYYAMFEYTNGFKKTMYWSKEKMMKHADKYSNAFSLELLKKIENNKIPQSDMWKYSSFWYKDFDGMAYKTMLRQLISKWGVMSIEMQQAFENDMAVIKEDGSKELVEYDENPIIEQEEPIEEVEAKLVEPIKEKQSTKKLSEL